LECQPNRHNDKDKHDPQRDDDNLEEFFARMTGGRWTADRLRIPPKKVDAFCGAHFLSAEACSALGR